MTVHNIEKKILMYIFQYPGTIRDNPTVGNVRKQEQSHPQQK